jgi:hypothetical protein
MRSDDKYSLPRTHHAIKRIEKKVLSDNILETDDNNDTILE